MLSHLQPPGIGFVHRGSALGTRPGGRVGQGRPGTCPGGRVGQGAASPLPTGVLGHTRAGAFTMRPLQDTRPFPVSACDA